MKLTSNIETVINNFQKLAANAENLDVSSALIAGLNAAMAAMKFRVFNTGKDVKGIAFGKYRGNKSRVTNRKYRIKKYGDTTESARDKKKKQKRLSGAGELTEYEKKRTAHGRQVQFKDLEFTGDLRRGIIVAKVSETKAVVFIPNKQLFKIAQYQTDQISEILGHEVVIFGMSDDERELLKTNINEALNQLYARFFNS